MRVTGSVLLLGLLVSGCGSSARSAPKADLVPVQGTVKLAGKPTSDVLVTLAPFGATKGGGGWGKTDSSGAFKLLHVSNQEGVEPGEYVICFSYLITADGTPVPPNTSPTEVNAVQGIATPWTESSSESLSQRVNVKKEGGAPLSFDVPLAKAAKKS